MPKSSWSMRKQVYVVLTASSILIALPTLGRGQAEVVMAVAGLTQSLLAAGGSGANPQMTAILAQTRMIEALHSRFDQVEQSLALILKQLANLKKDLREELDKDRDKQRMETVYGKAVTIQGLLDDLSREPNPNTSRAKRYHEQLEDRILNLREERIALEQRSDFVLPVLISAMVSEISAMQAVKAPPNDFRRALDRYDDRISRMQKVDRDGSLAKLRKDLEAAQLKAGKEIAAKISANKDASLAAGTFPWFKHVKQHTEERRDSVDCYDRPKTRSLDSLREDELPILIPVEPLFLTPEPICLGPPYTVTLSDHWREWHRSIELSPVQDANSSDLVRIVVSTIRSDPRPGGTAAPGHTNSDEDYERPFLEQHRLFEKDIQLFNERAMAILELRRLENLASAARVLIARWETNDAARVRAQAGMLSGGAVAALDKLEQSQLDDIVERRIRAMESARQEAWRVIEQSRREISQALDEARRNSWRGEWITLLGVLRASIQTYLAVDSALTAGGEQPQNKATSSSATTSKPTENKVTSSGTTTSKPQKDVRPKGSVTRPAKEAGALPQSQSSLSQPTPSERPTTDLARVLRVQQILADVKATSPRAWKQMPIEPTKEEIKLTEAIEHLNKLPSTAADKFLSDNQVTPGRFVGDVLKGGAAGGIPGAGKAGVIDALKPAIVADGTLLGEMSRNALRKEANELLADYARRRFIQDIKTNPLDLERYKDPCRTGPCIKPGWQ